MPVGQLFVLGANMDELTILRTVAACTTILAAAMVATNMNARITVAGFVIFIAASIAWMADGWFENKSSLVIQNVILLMINILGVWRWLPRAENEAENLGTAAAPSFVGKLKGETHAARAGKR
jgi:hypothetical protein